MELFVSTASTAALLRPVSKLNGGVAELRTAMVVSMMGAVPVGFELPPHDASKTRLRGKR
jgi:hypothetical protein